MLIMPPVPGAVPFLVNTFTIGAVYQCGPTNAANYDWMMVCITLEFFLLTTFDDQKKWQLFAYDRDFCHNGPAAWPDLRRPGSTGKHMVNVMKERMLSQITAIQIKSRNVVGYQISAKSLLG